MNSASRGSRARIRSWLNSTAIVGAAPVDAPLSLAHNRLGFRRFAITANASDPRAIRLFEYVGVEREGQLRGDMLRNGALIDSRAMARPRDSPPHTNSNSTTTEQ